MFSVGKRIAGCLSTVSSQHTVDHLIYEISQLLHEAEDPAVIKTHTERTSRVHRLPPCFAAGSCCAQHTPHKPPWV